MLRPVNSLRSNIRGEYDKFKNFTIMSTTTYQPSYGEIAVLGEMFEKEVKVRGINFPSEDQRTGAWIDYVQQYEEDQDTEQHIYCLEGVTCEKEVSEIDWDEVYG